MIAIALGRRDPQPGHRPAGISRSIDRPLISLTDLSTATLSLPGGVATTQRRAELCLRANGLPRSPTGAAGPGRGAASRTRP